MKGIILAGGLNEALPRHDGCLQTITAGVRQTNDLLSTDCADDCWSPRHFDHLDFSR